VGNDALVTMELDGHPNVYRDAKAAIWDVSALAAKFVELDPGSSASGPIGDEVLPAGRNTDSSDIYQILNIFDPQTRVAMSSMLRQMGGGAAGHGTDLHDFLNTSPAILTDAGSISEDLASPEFDMPDLLQSGERLASRFRGREQQISELVRQTDQTFQGVVVDGGQPLKDTLAKAPGTLSAVRPALDSLDSPLADTQAAMVNFKPGAAGLGHATPDLRGFLRDAIPVAHKVPDFSDDAKPAVRDVTDTVRDARPLAPRAADTFNFLQTPLHVLSPYGPEIGQWFTRMHSFVGQGPGNGKRYAHISVTFGAPEVTGGLVHSDTKHFIDAYPKPGVTDNERLRGGLPAGVPIGGH
jgi:phospholipid/cholesterol/gamma-HCH transport system substrate-binding protein